MSNPTIHDKLFMLVETIGIDKTEKILDDALSREVKFDSLDVENVVSVVSEKIGISPFEIVYGNGRKNERRRAIGFCSYYLSRTYKLTFDEIGLHLRKDPAIANKYAKEIKELNSHHQADKKYIEIRIDLDSILNP